MYYIYWCYSFFKLLINKIYNKILEYDFIIFIILFIISIIIFMISIVLFLDICQNSIIITQNLSMLIFIIDFLLPTSFILFINNEINYILYLLVYIIVFKFLNLLYYY